jgi:hypoxanthine phosphoribosyltransferase
MNRLEIGWYAFHGACEEVVKQLRRDCRARRSSVILGVARGGFVPASIVAYGLGISACRSADHQSIRSERDDLIVVDDICDTGRTFSLLRQSYPNALYVAAYAKPAGKEYCHYFGRLVDQSQWLVFPFAPTDEVNW